MNDDIDNQGPTTSIVFARLVAVRDIGRHDILDHNKPRERWDFETEPLANGVSLVAIHFPKWRHPHSARGKFVRAWLGEAFRPEVLANPQLLLGRAALLEIKTSVNSERKFYHWIVAARFIEE